MTVDLSMVTLIASDHAVKTFKHD